MSTRPKLLALVRHPVSALGVWITTLGAMVFLTFLMLDVLGYSANPYLGLVVFLISPGVFVFGLLLIPVGYWLDRRRRRGGIPIVGWPRLDLNVPRQRVIVLIVSLATLANIVVVSLAAVRGVEYMDSVEFCGQVCHEVMEPEFAAYQDGPHARVACVECHIGPGAPWFVRAKLSGLRQVFAVTFNTYSRPIPTPVKNLRPARDTCEQCHWPEKFHGDTLVGKLEFAPDESNTKSETMLRMHVGGLTPRVGRTTGIHWHVDRGNVIDYVALDSKREVIGKVVLRDGAGRVVREYVADGVSGAQLASGETRRMDCVDCHNRPTHPFAASAERAVDASLSAEAIDASLPFVKREAVSALKAAYRSRAEALATIGGRLERFYQSSYPQIWSTQKDAVVRAGRAVTVLYQRNMFPEMGVVWGSHPNHIGHTDTPGCFRCHDDSHKARDGRVISQDCELCHGVD